MHDYQLSHSAALYCNQMLVVYHSDTFIRHSNLYMSILYKDVASVTATCLK